jgi:hypothetical protein
LSLRAVTGAFIVFTDAGDEARWQVCVVDPSMVMVWSGNVEIGVALEMD